MNSIIPKNKNINKFIEEFNLKNGNKKVIFPKKELNLEHKSCAFCEACSYNKNYKSIMKLHGSKIWFTMHLIIESIPPEKEMTIKECATIWITLYTIINSLPCSHCTLTSLKWIQTISPPNNCPNNREDWMKELWKHHNEVNRDLWQEKAISVSETGGIYSWKKYMKDVEERHMTCGKMDQDDYLFGKIDDKIQSFTINKYHKENSSENQDNENTNEITEKPEITMKNVLKLL